MTLIPFGDANASVSELLAKSDATILIAEAGSIELDSVFSASLNIKNVVWVAKGGSKHIDWNEALEDVGNGVKISTWANIVDESSASSEVPAHDQEKKSGSLNVFAKVSSGSYELVEFTPEVC